MSLVIYCVCGAQFNRPSAKFCTKCGIKRPMPSTAEGGTNSLNTVSSSSGGGSSSYLHEQPSTPPPTTTALGATLAPSSLLVPTQPAATSGGSSSAGGGGGDAVEAMAQLADSCNAGGGGMSTLRPEGITPDMLQTPNASELQLWRKGSLLGRGTYGSVYLGLLPNGAFYAVKSVELGKKTGTFSPQELVSLSREITMMRRIQHPNICTFKGVYYHSEECTVNMFMEFVSGGSLSSVVKKFKPLPQEVVRRWTKQMLEGLCFLHGQGVIHRDVKGDNILVDMGAAPDSGAQIKLADFGAAKRLTDTVAQSQTIIGTPYWMAPEIVDVSGEGKGYSYKADVWSAGCTVAEMITGKPPWPQRPNAPAALFMIANAQGPPTEMPTAADGASEGCLDFLFKCFIRNPDDRPTVEELMQHPWIVGAS